jgi:hypothetical protein
MMMTQEELVERDRTVASELVESKDGRLLRIWRERRYGREYDGE